MDRLVVVASLTPVAVGDRFTTRDWPLHVTLVPTFVTPSPVDVVGDALRAAAARVPPLHVVVGGDARYGPRHTVPVSEVVGTPALYAAHSALVEGVRPCGVEFESPDYVGAGFGPHITHRPGQPVGPGDVAELTAVALVDMNPGQERGMRAVLAVGALGDG